MNDLEDLKETVAKNTCLNMDTMSIYDFFYKLNKLMTENKNGKNAGKRNN
jgi:hypothetical protein